MSIVDSILNNLTDLQKEILVKADEPGSIILFNIKGMIQVLHKDEPYDFIEMGYEDIQLLKKKGLISTKRSMQESHVLQGEEYLLSPLGQEVAHKIKYNE